MKKDSSLPERCQRLKELRGDKTQKEMSMLLDVTEKTYRSWEKGEYRKGCTEKTYPLPDSGQLIKMSEIFHCSIDYLLCRSDCTSVDNHYISQKTGLSETSINIISNKKCDILDAFIRSSAYKELEEYSLHFLELNFSNFRDYVKIIVDLYETASKTKDDSELERLAKIEDRYSARIEHCANSIESFGYRCSLSFGKFLDATKNELATKYEYDTYIQLLKKTCS